ncbi:MAG: hypothetical protein P0120_20580 [Nitrospira sp.]|nr:hypothetical protein [Nitrospira sp.]
MTWAFSFGRKLGCLCSQLESNSSWVGIWWIEDQIILKTAVEAAACSGIAWLAADWGHISSYEGSHPMGEAPRKAVAGQKGAMVLDTCGGRIHVEWDPAAAVPPLGQRPFCIECLKVSGLFEAWVADCPLASPSHHASATRTVLATVLLSILAGHHRDAPSTAMRHDGLPPGLVGVAGFVSEETARRALARMDESLGVAWLDRHRAKTTHPVLTTPWILDRDPTVQCLDGKQEGVGVGSTPKKPGRPAHRYQSAFRANTRLALAVDVLPGNGERPDAEPTEALGVAGCRTAGGAPRLAPRGRGRWQRIGAPRGRGSRSAVSHHAARHAAWAGPQKDALPLHCVGRGGTGVGRGR